MVEVNNCFAQECGKSVVGEAFSQDEENNIYCSEDFIRFSCFTSYTVIAPTFPGKMQQFVVLVGNLHLFYSLHY